MLNPHLSIFYVQYSSLFFTLPRYEVEEKGMSGKSISGKRLNLNPILDILLDTELKQLRVEPE